MAAESSNVPASTFASDDEIKKLMGKGKVHLVCNENLEAVKCFEEATKKLDAKYGQAADECGQAYFYYGKSLLEVARMEGQVLGNALQGAIDVNTQENDDNTETAKKVDVDKQKEKPTEKRNEEGTKENKTEKSKEKTLFVGPDISELDEDEKEKIGKDATDAMTEEAFKEAIEEDATKKDGRSSLAKETANKKAGGEAKQDTGSDGTKVEEPTEEAKNEEGEGEVDEPMDEEEVDEPMDEEESTEGADEEEEEEAAAEEDEPTYMELAWQMLEVARIIFGRQGKLMLAQCHLKLGEIQMEQEQFLGAVEDFLKCLDIQKEYLKPDDRLIAETAYNIGLAFSFQSMHEKSKSYYSQALETLDLRTKSLQTSIDEAEEKSKGKEKATADNPCVANRKELQELQELYPEIKAKVDDASEMMQQSKSQINVNALMGNGSTTIGFGQSSTQPPTTMIATKKAPVAVTDISHLVHRNKQRKPEDDNDDDMTAKKPRQDPEVAEPNVKAEITTDTNATKA